jgi:hypothetical protein
MTEREQRRINTSIGLSYGGDLALEAVFTGPVLPPGALDMVIQTVLANCMQAWVKVENLQAQLTVRPEGESRTGFTSSSTQPGIRNAGSFQVTVNVWIGSAINGLQNELNGIAGELHANLDRMAELLRHYAEEHPQGVPNYEDLIMGLMMVLDPFGLRDPFDPFSHFADPYGKYPTPRDTDHDYRWGSPHGKNFT